jgi:hypothetical protein
MSAYSTLRRLAPLAALALAAAELPAQWGVSSRTYQKDKPPYYQGKRPPVGARIAWTPVATPTMRAAFTRAGEAPSGEMRTLLDSINGRLAAMMGAGPRVADERLPALLGEKSGAPEIVFGCEPEFAGEAVRVGKYYHSAGCEEPEKDQQPRNALIVQNPTKQWRQVAATTIAGDSAQYLLLLSLRIGDQYPWSGWSGKGVRLGTGYDLSLPWLSAVDRPVTVVQLVGTVVDREGKVVRSGAEGLLASKPGALATLLGGQQAVSDRQLAELVFATRRDDLPGQPMAWEIALRTLVSELTNRDPAELASR